MAVVGNDAVTEMYGLVQTVEIDTENITPETLITVRLDDDEPVSGVVKVAGVGPWRKERFVEPLGTLSIEAMERIEIALRALFDL